MDSAECACDESYESNLCVDANISHATSMQYMPTAVHAITVMVPRLGITGEEVQRVTLIYPLHAAISTNCQAVIAASHSIGIGEIGWPHHLARTTAVAVTCTPIGVVSIQNMPGSV